MSCYCLHASRPIDKECFGSKRLSLTMTVTFLLSFTLGCSVQKQRLQSSLERSAAKRSFVSWNLRAMVTEPREAAQSRAFKIASLSNRELYQLMVTRPSPDWSTISGNWNGINKGVGAAMMGLMQDVKVLEGSECISGYNIVVKQVPIGALPCRGWQPERDPTTCKPKTMGNFVAVAPTYCGKLGHAVKLDYTIAENPWYDPSRFLVDDLVAIDEDILLGRATAKIGALHVPVAYFVLVRAPQCECVHCNKADATPTLKREIVDREIIAPPLSQRVEEGLLGVDVETQSAEREIEIERVELDAEYEESASDKTVAFPASEPALID